MIKHVVSFKLRGDAETRRRVAREFADAILALPSQIECLLAVEAGINENPAEEWDVALIATVKSLEDVAVYSAHPAHQAAAAILKDYKEARAAVDFEL